MLEAIEEQLKMEPTSKGPLAEIDFWRERNASFAALLEQLKRPEVQHMRSVLAAAKNPLIDNFDMAKSG